MVEICVKAVQHQSLLWCTLSWCTGWCNLHHGAISTGVQSRLSHVLFHCEPEPSTTTESFLTMMKTMMMTMMMMMTIMMTGRKIRHSAELSGSCSGRSEWGPFDLSFSLLIMVRMIIIIMVMLMTIVMVVLMMLTALAMMMTLVVTLQGMIRTFCLMIILA